jgi:hypothetical protein
LEGIDAGKWLAAGVGTGQIKIHFKKHIPVAAVLPVGTYRYPFGVGIRAFIIYIGYIPHNNGGCIVAGNGVHGECPMQVGRARGYAAYLTIIACVKGVAFWRRSLLNGALCSGFVAQKQHYIKNAGLQVGNFFDGYHQDAVLWQSGLRTGYKYKPDFAYYTQYRKRHYLPDNFYICSFANLKETR